MGYTEHEVGDTVIMTQEECNEYLLKHENFIRCSRCKNLIHSSNKYCQYCGCPNEKELQAIKKARSSVPILCLMERLFLKLFGKPFVIQLKKTDVHFKTESSYKSGYFVKSIRVSKRCFKRWIILIINAVDIVDIFLC